MTTALGVLVPSIPVNERGTGARRRRDRRFRRWERGGAMELWQMDVVGGVLLANGTSCKILTGIDDHSRFVVCAGWCPERPAGRCAATSPRPCASTGSPRRSSPITARSSPAGSARSSEAPRGPWPGARLEPLDPAHRNDSSLGFSTHSSDSGADAGRASGHDLRVGRFSPPDRASRVGWGRAWGPVPWSGSPARSR
jgi:hypothetical protein